MEFSDVFISYRRKDVEFVKKIDQAFKADGREVWIDWEDIPPGSTEFSDDIKRGIEGADVFLAVLSPNYLESTYCVDLELGYAVELQKKIVPIVYEKFEGMDIPDSVASINWVYFTPHAGQSNTFEEAFPRVLQAIDSDLEHSREHTRVLIRAQEWDNNNRKSSYLLDGEEIIQAEAWLANSAEKKPVPTELHKLYVLESRNLQTRRARTIITAISVSLVFTILLAILAIFFWIDASNQRETAENNLDIAYTAESVANQNAATATVARGQAENSAATAVVAQQQAEISLERSRSIALAASALLAIQQENHLLAVALALEAINTDDVPIESELILQQVAYQPGVRYHLEQAVDAPNALSTNGNVTLLSGQSGNYRLVDANDNPIATFLPLQDNTVPASGILNSPNGQYTLTLNGDNTQFQVVNNGSGQVIIDSQTRFNDHINGINLTLFSADSTTLLTADGIGTVFGWNLMTGEYTLQDHEFPVNAAALSLDGAMAMTVSAANMTNMLAGDLIVWETNTGLDTIKFTESVLARTPLGISENGMMVLFEEDSAIEFTVWDTWNGMLENVLRTPIEPDDVRFINNNSVQVPDSINNTWIGYDLATNAQLSAPPPYTYGQVIYRDDNAILAWDATTGTLTEENTATNSTRTVYMAPQGTQILTSNADVALVALCEETNANNACVSLTVNLIDVPTGTVRNTISTESTAIQAEITRDGNYAALVREGGFVDIFDLNSNDIIQQFASVLPRPRIAFAPDSRHIAYTDEDNITYRDIITGDTIQAIIGFNVAPSDVAISPDGQFIAGGFGNGRVNVWNIATATVMYEYSGEWADTFVEFSPEGNKLAIVAQSLQMIGENNLGVLTVWRLDPLNGVAQWTRDNRATPDLTCEERAVYNIQPLCDGSVPQQNANTPAGLTATPSAMPDSAPTGTPDVMQGMQSMMIAQVGENMGTLTTNATDQWEYMGVAGETLNLRTNSDFNTQLRVLDMDGNEIMSSPIQNGNASIDALMLSTSAPIIIEVAGYTGDDAGTYTLIIESN